MNILRKVMIVMLIFTLTFGVKKVVLAENFSSSKTDYYDENFDTSESDYYNEEEEKANNINKLSKEVNSNHSNGIIFVEVFCGVIGIIFLVMALKATSD